MSNKIKHIKDPTVNDAKCVKAVRRIRPPSPSSKAQASTPKAPMAKSGLTNLIEATIKTAKEDHVGVM